MVKSKNTKNKNKRQSYQRRIPVIYKGKPLTPCTISRSYKIVKEGRGIFVRDKIFGWYLKLKKLNVRTKKTVKFSLGIDPGTMFTGFSVTSKKFNFNFEIENTLKFLDTKHFLKKTEEKRMYRRMRRSGLRHREMRIDNRIGRKISYTSNYYYQNIRNFVERISRFYPIAYIVIEDVSFNHFVENKDYKKGSSFSNLEVNKIRLYDKLNSISRLYISSGNTHLLRRYLPLKYRKRKRIRDEMYIDLKFKNKASKSFRAHCLDSFCLSCIPFGERFNFNPEFLYIRRANIGFDKIRRELERIQTPKSNPESRHLSKLRKIRIKVDDSTRSNHLKSWRYMYVEREITYSKEKRKYGTSFYLSTQGKKGLFKAHRKGDNKYKTDLGYIYYDVLRIKSSDLLYNISRLFESDIDLTEMEVNTIGNFIRKKKKKDAKFLSR